MFFRCPGTVLRTYMPYVPDRHDRTHVLNMLSHVCLYVRLCAHAGSPGIVSFRQQATHTYGDELMMSASLVWFSDVTFFVALHGAGCHHGCLLHPRAYDADPWVVRGEQRV